MTLTTARLRLAAVLVALAFLGIGLLGHVLHEGSYSANEVVATLWRPDAPAHFKVLMLRIAALIVLVCCQFSWKWVTPERLHGDPSDDSDDVFAWAIVTPEAPRDDQNQ